MPLAFPLTRAVREPPPRFDGRPAPRVGGRFRSLPGGGATNVCGTALPMLADMLKAVRRAAS